MSCFITCPAGLRRAADATSVWIRSPRTGAELAVSYVAAKAKLPAAMIRRVIAGASAGHAALEFTSEELKAFSALAQEEVPPPPGSIRCRMWVSRRDQVNIVLPEGLLQISCILVGWPFAQAEGRELCRRIGDIERTCGMQVVERYIVLSAAELDVVRRTARFHPQFFKANRSDA